ncbi:F-box/FBD/LRR-repeat protein [Melia azedarach]|uniref:F-box/FBD/LRR-repeat protein n=2 Tax=Melia azedarach TaxID=155640 RepID=A0ACC1X908_MELAZ|nr:F-box/FBD/LRR-repeat protein [Melia azedarach]KAJ4707184.1 F-box/FBD/LRR-repeat protein [Melia azedarach]
MTEMEKQAKFDRISNLPWDVLDTILINLPLRDAARTSILSRKWRYKWTGLSQFVFDDKCFSSFLSEKARWGEIMKIIQMVRTYHRGPIEKFKLTAYCYPNFCDLEQWLQFLTEKGIKELILQDFTFMKRFKLPCCVFSCPQLSCLELYGCVLKLPSTFKGLHCLKSLQLSQVSIISDTLESLIHNCPILERLTLLNVNHLASVRIHNPSLKYLKIDSKFGDINLEHSVQLTSVDIQMIPLCRGAREHERGDASHLLQVFGCLYDVKRLIFSSRFLEWLASDKVPPERLPIMLNHLMFLDLKDIKLSNLKELMASLAIFRSCPNLEELTITVVESNSSRPTTDFLKAMCLCGFLFHKLKVGEDERNHWYQI